MSRKRAPNVPFATRWMQAVLLSEANVAGRRVASVLLAHADADGRCYPSVPRIMWFARAGRGTVFSGIASLERNGLIRRESGYVGKSNHYTLTVPTRSREWSDPVATVNSPVQSRDPEVLQEDLQEVPENDFPF